MSYYAATALPASEFPALRDDMTVDVCIIGAGVAGCSAALHLAERGYRVAVLEAERVGWGASGRSGGQIIPGYACGQEKLTGLLGDSAARTLWDISVEAVDLVRERVDRHHIACDLRWGQMQVALKSRQRRELLQWQRAMEDLYHYRSLRFLDAAEVQEQVNTHRYVAGLLDSASGHLHPLNYTLGLAEAARGAGALFFEHTRALSLSENDPSRVVTATGTVSARFVVLCCNAYVAGLSARLAARIMPVGTYIVGTEMLGEERARALIPNDVAVSDTNFVLNYFRRSADHRLLFGGRVSYSGLHMARARAATRGSMLRVFPQLAAVGIDFTWGGYVDISLNRAPDFGRLRDNVYYLQGFSGHGLALAGMAGKIVAAALAGQAERFDLFARIPHRNFFGGRALRMPALVLGMLWYRMKDWL